MTRRWISNDQRAFLFADRAFTRLGTNFRKVRQRSCSKRRRENPIKKHLGVAKRRLACPMSIANINRMNVTDLPIVIDRERLAAFCRARGIRKLSLFGSVLRDDFDPERSDVDVLVEMDPTARTGFRFFGYGDELAEIIGHKVDLTTPAMLSRYFRDEVLRDALQIYEQT
jgi:hypothetical protein